MYKSHNLLYSTSIYLPTIPIHSNIICFQSLHNDDVLFLLSQLVVNVQLFSNSWLNVLYWGSAIENSVSFRFNLFTLFSYDSINFIIGGYHVWQTECINMSATNWERVFFFSEFELLLQQFIVHLCACNNTELKLKIF